MALQTAHAYTKLPAGDMQRARRFYVQVLGFQPTSEGDRYIWFDNADGSSVLVFLSSGRASGDHDQCGFVVDDFDAEVADLRRRGIVFEEFAGLTNPEGVAADGAWRSAWFRDSEGNLLNVRTKARRGE